MARTILLIPASAKMQALLFFNKCIFVIARLYMSLMWLDCEFNVVRQRLINASVVPALNVQRQCNVEDFARAGDGRWIVVQRLAQQLNI
jgi:hypothetical protein